MITTIDPEQREVLQREFIAALHDAGLVVVPKYLSVKAVDVEKRKRELLQQRSVTTYEIEKYKLLPRTRATVLNWVAKGVIKKGEWYKDDKGVTRVLTIAIKRLNNE